MKHIILSRSLPYGFVLQMYRIYPESSTTVYNPVFVVFWFLGQALTLRGFVPVLLESVAQSASDFYLRQVLEALLDARANADTTKDVSASASTIRTFQECTNNTPKEYQYISEGVLVKLQGSLPTESLRDCFYCSSGRAYSWVSSRLSDVPLRVTRECLVNTQYTLQ